MGVDLTGITRFPSLRPHPALGSAMGRGRGRPRGGVGKGEGLMSSVPL